MKAILAILFAFCILSAKSQEQCAPCKSVNHVNNGDFNNLDGVSFDNDGWTGTNNLPDWTATDDKIEIWNYLYSWTSDTDGVFVELRPDQANDGVQQTIDGLTPGVSYEINFQAGTRPNSGYQQFSVIWNDQQVGEDVGYTSSGSTPNFYWQDGKYIITAEKADGNVLKIVDSTPADEVARQSYGNLLDSVSVAPCACPSGFSNQDNYDYDIHAGDINQGVSDSTDTGGGDFNAASDCEPGKVCIDIETRPYYEIPSDYKAAFESAPSGEYGYCSVEDAQFPLKNQNLCTGGLDKDIIWHVTFHWNAESNGHLYIDFGVDFGGGYIAYVDGQYLQSQNDNMWWDGRWDAESEMIIIDTQYSAGPHQIEVYGYEDCCDGTKNVRYYLLEDIVAGPWDYDCELGKLCVDWQTKNMLEAPEKSDDGVQFGENMKAQWDTAFVTAGYCSVQDQTEWPITNERQCSGPDKDIGWKFDLYWNSETSGDAFIQFGVDFGWGFVAYVDGVYDQSSQEDMWWNGDWTSSHVITMDVPYAAGSHLIEIYGGEGCCDGDKSLQYEFHEFIDPDTNSKKCDQVTIYEECDYGGASMLVNGNIDCLDWQPKSICIPEGFSANVYESCYYADAVVNFTENNKCFPGADSTNFLATQAKSKKALKESIAKVVVE